MKEFKVGDKVDDLPLPLPLPDMEVDTEVIVWNEYIKRNRYFSHFDKDGNIWCFASGKTSFSSGEERPTRWPYWEPTK